MPERRFLLAALSQEQAACLLRCVVKRPSVNQPGSGTMNARKASITESLRKQIELRAYALWEQAGRPHGCAEEHWAQAEAEILKPKKAAPQKKAKAAPKQNSKPKKK
ncbi:MAG: DUF2934 domain-containing protein [Alphaproteobacteria bacterium]|nr:DUF2934 domain-containing protein [Alphaproteobacteria bacterium]